MSIERKATIITYGLLLCAGVVSVSLPSKLPVASATPVPLLEEDVLTLTGIVRDFPSTHPDFNVTDVSSMGHYAQNVSSTLGADGKPQFTSAGRQVTSQWRDAQSHVIMPYGGAVDPGLPGGHFDVDVYDKPNLTKAFYHKHEFDDTYDVTYIDVAKDTKLLFANIIPATYANNLKVVFMNVNNGGGGSYKFQAGGALMTGQTSDGFTATFSRSQLTELRVDFAGLGLLRGTQPNVSQKNAVTRDTAFAIRIYDAVTNVLKYEIAVYHHIKPGTTTTPITTTPPPTTFDACGKPINDTLGTFGSAGSGATHDGASFNDWYSDVLGTNLSKNETITLHKNTEGVYEYLSNQFYPADGQLLGNEGEQHNNFFTFNISATFTYHKCTGQFFEFQGNDDCWVFINGKLVMDIGGANTPSGQYVSLDRLGLTDGQEFTLDFFYAHRRETPSSLFHMRTNLELGSTITMPVTGGFD